MQETLQDFNTTTSIGGRPFCNLPFADDIGPMGSSGKELQDLTNRLEEKARAYVMEVSSEKSKVLVNSTNQNTRINITMNGQNLEAVDSFKYLGSTLSKDGASTKEIKIRMAVAISAMSKLNIIRNSRNTSFKTKLNLYRTLAVSILLYGCETWTLTAETERRLQTFEPKCSTRLLRIS